MIKMGYQYKLDPKDDFFAEVMDLINEDDLGVVGAAEWKKCKGVVL